MDTGSPSSTTFLLPASFWLPLNETLDPLHNYIADWVLGYIGYNSETAFFFFLGLGHSVSLLIFHCWIAELRLQY